MSISLIEQPPDLVFGCHHPAYYRYSVVQPGVQFVASSVTLDVFECEGLHFTLWIDVGNSGYLRTEDNFCVVREEVQLKIRRIRYRTITDLMKVVGNHRAVKKVYLYSGFVF